MSITGPVGSSVIITCDIHTIGNYIYWYRFQEGRTPQYLLSYNFISSTNVVDSGLNSKKYHVYEGPDKTYKFVLRNVEESDAGLYYCANWLAQ
ncbi:T cell receptor gamma variable 8 [Lemmus lemmus]